MSRINFDILEHDYPKFGEAFRSLQQWLGKHPDANLINPMAVARELPKVDVTSLAIALTLLVDAGFLKRTYKVLTPNGVLTDDEFEDPRRIPERLPDRMENYFDTAEADIVPVFHLVA